MLWGLVGMLGLVTSCGWQKLHLPNNSFISNDLPPENCAMYFRLTDLSNAVVATTHHQKWDAS